MTNEQKKSLTRSLPEDSLNEADTTGATAGGIEEEDGLMELAPGSKAGRYMILDQLGRGGMGVVYKAYDPELDRQIALKLLSTKRKSATRAEQAKERLLREAQALARLSHPNVVSAYDVGTIGGEVFVAMELLDGLTLKDWIKENQPSLQKIVEVMVSAGRGIEAAHKVGLIHRDIKPDNIIVGADGRVRVLDFGLALVASKQEIENANEDMKNWEGDTSISGLSTELGGHSGTGASRPLTMDGVIMGTPGYMAPEQYMGSELDAYSDQYSFSVTLFEALYGIRPHHARSFKELREKVTSKSIDPPPQEVKIPGSLKRIVLQGLALYKADRFPSMTKLLRELSKDPWVLRRRILLVATVLVLLAATFVGASQWQSMKNEKCQGAENKIAGIWDKQAKSKVGRAFTATGKQYAAATFERVDRLLDQHAQQWVQERTEACQATRVHGDQSEQLMDLRIMCLDRRLAEFKALINVFARGADDKVLDQAVQAVAGLPHLEQCRDVKTLASRGLPPKDEATRKQVATIRDQLAMADALEMSGKYAEGLGMADKASTAAGKVDYLPLEAETMYELGKLQQRLSKYDEAQKSFNRAIWLADYSGLDEIRVKAMIKMIFLKGYQQYKFKDAQEMGEFTKAVIGRLGNDGRTLANWNKNVGLVYFRAGDHRAAIDYFYRALKLMEKTLGPDHLEVASVLNSLGTVVDKDGDYDKAAKYLVQAIQIWKKSLGPNHPEVAKGYNNLGVLFYERGDYTRAMEYYTSSLKIRELALGPKHSEVGVSLINMGLVYSEQGDYPQAMAHFVRALENWEAALGKEHPHLAHILNGMGNVFLYQGKLEQARIQFERVQTILRKTQVARHPETSWSQNGLGWITLQQGQKTKARAHFEQVLQICGDDKCTADRLQPLAEARFGLSKVLGKNGKNRARALRLAKLAQADFQQLHMIQAKTNLDAVKAWLFTLESKER